jgi:pimeloyl-ACP methyl ester carboxylesterase
MTKGALRLGSADIDFLYKMCYNVTVMPHQNQDYKFADGAIRYSETNYAISGGSATTTTSLEQSMKIIDAPEVGDDRLKTVRAELAGKVAESATGGGIVEYAVLNQDNPTSNGAIIYNMGIGGDFHHPVGAREAEVLAWANPDQQIILINNTGSGRSTLIPREIMRQMKKDGIYEPQGEWMLQILEYQLEQYGDKIALWGGSAGARVALGMAAAFGAAGQKIDNLRVVDPPSAINRTWFGIQMRFVSQILAMHGYGASPYRETDELEAQVSNLFKAKGALGDNMWNYPLAMRRASGLMKDIDGAMGAVRGDLTIMQPENSEFADSDNSMKRSIGNAAAQHVGAFPEIVRYISIEDHSHAILSDNAGARPQITIYEIAKRNNLHKT